MKHTPFLPASVALLTLVISGCGALPGGGEPDPAAQTAQAELAARQAALDQTSTAVVVAQAQPAEEEAPPPEEALPEEAPPAETATPTLGPMEMTLAAVATQQAPTAQAGQTLAAQTQAALPTSTPLSFEILSSTTNETITQDDVEITVTAIVPPQTSLPQAWTEIYAAPDGVPFTVTTDEEAMALSIQNAMAASGYGENVSDLTVSLNNNLITVEFTITLAGAGADGRISFAAFAQNGQAVVTMTSLQFGRFTVPPEILDALTVAINQAITGAGDTAQAEVTIEDIFIDDGVMIITGTVGV